MQEWVAIAEAEEVPTSQGMSVEYEDKKIALFKVADRIYALEDWCPHVGAELSKGSCEGLMLTCPWHNVVYSLSTGAALSEDNYGPARVFPVRIREGKVEIDWSQRRYTHKHP